jgi:outer membrane protein OmpA-like peptidoglycan-associated protein
MIHKSAVRLATALATPLLSTGLFVRLASAAEASPTSANGEGGEVEAGASFATSSEPPPSAGEASVESDVPPAVASSVSASAEEAPVDGGAATPRVPAYAGARVEHRIPADPDTEPYLDRYRPECNLWEVGLYTGLFMPAYDHNLKVAALPYEPYNPVSATLGARLAYFPLSFAGVEVEASVSPSATRDSNKSALFYALRGHAILQLPMLRVVPFALVGGGLLGAISEPMGHDGDPAFHFGIGVKSALNRVVGLRLDLRDTLTQQGRGAPPGSAAHNFEVLLGATFTFDRKEATRPPPDVDYDGLYDSEDSCPDVGALTLDGCPHGDDSDGDGFLDGDDLCPDEPGAPGTDCPAPGPVEAKPTPSCEPGSTLGPNGCESADPDGDGLVGAADKCPTEPETQNGFEEGDGCPDTLPEAVKQFTGVIEGITFAKGKSSIDPQSSATLDEAARVLLEYPSIRLEVSGHTSSDGPARYNQKVSEQRATAVADYLKAKGVPESQITTRGAGSSEPIADNSTANGREQNRRIEFRVLTKK